MPLFLFLQAAPYADYLTWVLAALAVMLTAVGVFIAGIGLLVAIMAIWGYRAIVDEATKKATARADAAVQAKLEEYFKDKEIQDKLKEAIWDRVAIEYDMVPDTATAGSTASESQAIADIYPGEEASSDAGNDPHSDS